MSDPLLGVVTELFVAFGRSRETDRARLWVEDLRREISCSDCAELAARNLRLEWRKMPELADLLRESRDVMNSAAHVPHIVSPQLAPRSETWWRSNAVRLILPHVEGDRNLAAFVAAQLWWSRVDADPDRVVYEITNHPIWISAARTFTAGKDLPDLVEAAFRRARWVTEHANDEEIPQALLNLEAASA